MKKEKSKVVLLTFSNFFHLGRLKTTHHKISMKIYSERANLALYKNVLIKFEIIIYIFA